MKHIDSNLSKTIVFPSRARAMYITLENALFHNTTNEFHVKTAKTAEEACELVEVGFEYVTVIDGVQIFRKRK